MKKLLLRLGIIITSCCIIVVGCDLLGWNIGIDAGLPDSKGKVIGVLILAFIGIGKLAEMLEKTGKDE
mgnify:CR=1 FL=1